MNHNVKRSCILTYVLWLYLPGLVILDLVLLVAASDSDY
jgi:hypothetical protein